MSRSYPRHWVLNARRPDPASLHWSSYTHFAESPVITLDDLDVTQEEAQLITYQRRGNLRYNYSHRYFRLSGIEVTQEEVNRIQGGEDPVDVLLGTGKKYWLKAVPWQPGEEKA